MLVFCNSGLMFELRSAGGILKHILRSRGTEGLFDSDLRSAVMKKTLRFKKLINWTVQGPIILRILAHMATYNIALFALLLMAWSIRSLMSSLGGEPVASDYFVFKRDAAPVLLCMAVMTPFMVWDLISLTNRIAGPLYRFEALMKDFVKSGTLKQANLRDRDLLTGFQKQFNEFVEALHALHPETVPITASSNDESKSLEESALKFAAKTANADAT